MIISSNQGNIKKTVYIYDWVFNQIFTCSNFLVLLLRSCSQWDRNGALSPTMVPSLQLIGPESAADVGETKSELKGWQWRWNEVFVPNGRNWIENKKGKLDWQERKVVVSVSATAQIRTKRSVHLNLTLALSATSMVYNRKWTVTITVTVVCVSTLNDLHVLKVLLIYFFLFVPKLLLVKRLVSITTTVKVINQY